MRKLLFALLLAPLACNAELVIEGGAPTPAQPVAASTAVAAPAVTPASPSPAATASPSIPAASAPVVPHLDIKPVWRVELADSTFQRLFARWSTLAGWTLVWDVPQDIPVIGQYSFSGSFTDAVLTVTDSTDGTDMPVHPCFYSNSLARIVPVSVVCNPDNN